MADLWITADETSGFASGGNSYSNSDLKGQLFDLELRGAGFLEPGVEWDYLTDGGFEWLIPHDIQHGETYVIHKINAVESNSSNYTNGFDIAKILPALRQRIGWRQPTVAGAPVINATNRASVSGLYFQGAHAMCTPSEIKAVQEDPNISDDDFNTVLSNLQDEGIMRCLNEVFREPELLEQHLMFTRFGVLDQPINNNNQFVGYLINIANRHDISTQIHFASLYFDKDVTFNLYLFLDGNREPIKTIRVSANAFEHTVVEFDSLILNYKLGRKYYFGYFQAQLGNARAIKEQVDFFADTKCFEAFPIVAQAGNMYDWSFVPDPINPADFNRNYRQYPYLPYGLNLEISSFRDHTQKILRKSNLFDEAQRLTMAAMALEMITTTGRSNITERQTKGIADRLFMENNQAFPTKEVPVTSGLKSRLIGEYTKLKKTFFPDSKPVSYSMENTHAFGLEQSWYDQNYRQITNPPPQVP